MSISKELKARLEKNQRENEEILKKIKLETLNQKVKFDPELILNNDGLYDLIIDLPKSELNIVINEVICSSELTELFEKTISTSSKLARARKSKEDKAEKRRMKTSVTKSDDESLIGGEISGICKGVAGEIFPPQA